MGKVEHEGEGPVRQDLVRRLEAICAERRFKLTPMRRRVLAILADADGRPFRAHDIAEAIGRVGEKPVSRVLVYRALDFLIGLGLVHRIESRNAFLACGQPDHHHGRGAHDAVVFLMCASCGSVGEAAAPPGIGRGLAGTAAAAGFRPERPILEVEGECAACQGRESIT